jgi:hypothetical protein
VIPWTKEKKFEVLGLSLDVSLEEGSKFIILGVLSVSSIKAITQACKTKLFNRCFDFDN